MIDNILNQIKIEVLGEISQGFLIILKGVINFFIIF